MTKNSLGIPFLCKINEPQTIHIMKVRFLYLLCLLTCILPACSSDDNEPVDEPVTITGVSVSPESISLECGETKQLTAKISPENATAGDITWTSSDEAIATVSSDGTVTGISKGTTTVTATVSGKSGTCEVTVTQEVQSVEISPATATLTSKGETIQLTATVLPEGGRRGHMDIFRRSSSHSITRRNCNSHRRGDSYHHSYSRRKNSYLYNHCQYLYCRYRG